MPRNRDDTQTAPGPSALSTLCSTPPARQHRSASGPANRFPIHEARGMLCATTGAQSGRCSRRGKGIHVFGTFDKNQFRDRSFPYPNNAALGVACLTWWAPYTRLRRLPGTLTYGTSSTSGTIARGPSPSKSWRPSGGATGTARPCICNTSRSAAELRLRSPCCGTTRGPTARRRGAGPTRGGCQSPRSLNWRTSEAASMRHGHSISLLCLLLLCYLLLCLRRGQPCTTSRLRQRLRRPCCPSE